VVVGLGDDFDTTSIDETANLGDELGCPHFGLFEPDTGDAKTDLEARTFFQLLF